MDDVMNLGIVGAFVLQNMQESPPIVFISCLFIEILEERELYKAVQGLEMVPIVST